jgi:hypothetical protein
MGDKQKAAQVAWATTPRVGSSPRSFHAEARRLVDRLEATSPSHPNHVNAADNDHTMHTMHRWRQPTAMHPRPDR